MFFLKPDPDKNKVTAVELVYYLGWSTKGALIEYMSIDDRYTPRMLNIFYN